MSTSLSNRRRGRGSRILPGISIVFLIASFAWFIFELVNFGQDTGQLPADITLAGIPVGNMDVREAEAELERQYAEPVILYYDDSPIILNPDTINFRISKAAMIADARATGNLDGSFWLRFASYLLNQNQSQAADIPLQASYQENQLRELLVNIAKRYDRSAGKPAFDLEALTISPGFSGLVLDIDAAIHMIDSALRHSTNRTVTLPLIQVDSSQLSMETLQELIIALLDSKGFIYDGQTTVASIFILDLITGEEINILGDVTFSAASTIKVSIMVDFYRHLTFPPTQEEAWLMANSLLCSNNSSSNLLMQIVGGGSDIFSGISSVTNTTQYIGAQNTYITAPFYLGIEGQELGSIPAPPTSPNPNFNTNPDPFNQTTAEDMGAIFSLIYDCANNGSGLIAAFPNGEFTQQECQQMIELMSANDLQRLLQAGLPQGTRISHKNGWIFDTVGDTGIVFPPNGHDYVISVYLWEETEFQDYEKLWPLIEEISRATWNYFSPENALLVTRSDIPVSAQECEGNYLPPGPELVDLDNINGWRSP